MVLSVVSIQLVLYVILEIFLKISIEFLCQIHENGGTVLMQFNLQNKPDCYILTEIKKLDYQSAKFPSF